MTQVSPAGTKAFVNASGCYTVMCYLILLVTGVSFKVLRKSGNAPAPDDNHSVRSIKKANRMFLALVYALDHLLPCWLLKVPSSSIRQFFALMYAMMILVPALLNTAVGVGAIFLLLAEGWDIYDCYMYVWQDTFSVGPYVDKAPQTTAGRALAALISVFVYVLTQVVLGMSGGLRINDALTAIMPRTVWGFLRVVCLYSPAILLGVAAVHALVLSVLEGWNVFEALEWVVDVLCNVEDTLTSDAPARSSSLFLSSLFLGVTLVASGSLLTVVGSHPTVLALVEVLNGAYEDYSDSECRRQGADSEVDGKIRDGEDGPPETKADPASPAESPIEYTKQAGSLLGNSLQEQSLADVLRAPLERPEDETPSKPEPFFLAPQRQTDERRRSPRVSPRGWCSPREDALRAKERPPLIRRPSPQERQANGRSTAAPCFGTPSAPRPPSKSPRLWLDGAVAADEAATGEAATDEMCMASPMIAAGSPSEPNYAQLLDTLALRDAQLREKSAMLARTQEALRGKDAEILTKVAQMQAHMAELSSKDAELDRLRCALDASHLRELKLHEEISASARPGHQSGRLSTPAEINFRVERSPQRERLHPPTTPPSPMLFAAPRARSVISHP